jgi:hypothetical protein
MSLFALKLSSTFDNLNEVRLQIPDLLENKIYETSEPQRKMLEDGYSHGEHFTGDVRKIEKIFDEHTEQGGIYINWDADSDSLDTFPPIDMYNTRQAKELVTGLQKKINTDKDLSYPLTIETDNSKANFQDSQNGFSITINKINTN